MLCYDVEDFATSGVDLLSEIDAAVERWQRDLLDPDHADRERLQEFGPEWDELYRRMGGVFEKGFKLIQSIESHGCEIEGKQAYLTAWSELRAITSLSPTRITAAASRSKRGEGKTLGEIERALPNQAR